jgi:hypothetical protein
VSEQRDRRRLPVEPDAHDAAEARATGRFETLPARQLQIDFGEKDRLGFYAKPKLFGRRRVGLPALRAAGGAPVLPAEPIHARRR